MNNVEEFMLNYFCNSNGGLLNMLIHVLNPLSILYTCPVYVCVKRLVFVTMIYFLHDECTVLSYKCSTHIFIRELFFNLIIVNSIIKSNDRLKVKT